MASCGLDIRCGTSGSGFCVVTTTVLPSARAVSPTPLRMRGSGEASVAAVSEATTCSAVSSVPSWKVTPSRIVKTHSVGLVCSHSVARAGSASPFSSRTMSVSAVDQRESLNASSLSGVRPLRGGCSMAMLIRPPPSPEPSPEEPAPAVPELLDEPPEKQPARARVLAAARTTRPPRRREGREVGDMSAPSGRECGGPRSQSVRQWVRQVR